MVLTMLALAWNFEVKLTEGSALRDAVVFEVKLIDLLDNLAKRPPITPEFRVRFNEELNSLQDNNPPQFLNGILSQFQNIGKGKDSKLTPDTWVTCNITLHQRIPDVQIATFVHRFKISACEDNLNGIKRQSNASSNEVLFCFIVRHIVCYLLVFYCLLCAK